MGWFQTVSDAFYKALCASFNVDPESDYGLKKFVPAYIESATNVQAPRNLNVCYYAISEMQDTDMDYITIGQVAKNNVSYGTIGKNIPVDILVTFYGPNADDEAEEFWSMFQWDYGADSPRAILRNENIVPLGKPSRPLSVYEVEGTFQRRRCDVRVNLVYMEIKEKLVDMVDSAPEIAISTDN